MLESIDSNVDSSLQYTEQAEGTMSTYLNNLSSDRAMILKAPAGMSPPDSCPRTHWGAPRQVLAALLVFGLFFLLMLN